MKLIQKRDGLHSVYNTSTLTQTQQQVTGQTDPEAWFQLSDPDEPFSVEFQTDLLTLGVHATNVRALALDCRSALEFCQTVSSTFEVTYEHRGKRLGKVALQYDLAWFQGTLEKFLKYWEGSKPRGVPKEEGWKCNLCSFSGVCLLSRKHVK
jgi:hypothetical protein